MNFRSKDELYSIPYVIFRWKWFVLLRYDEFIKPILILTKTLIGNLQGSDGPLLGISLSRNASYNFKVNY